jgi:hypothetical protein
MMRVVWLLVLLLESAWIGFAYQQPAARRNMTFRGTVELTSSAESPMTLVTLDADDSDGVIDSGFLIERRTAADPLKPVKAVATGEYAYEKSLLILPATGEPLVLAVNLTDLGLTDPPSHAIQVQIAGITRLVFDRTTWSHAEFANFVFRRFKKLAVGEPGDD